MSATLTASECPATPQVVSSRVAKWYDMVNGVASLGRDKVWRRQAVRPLATTEPIDVLDLCCGTGTMTQPLQRWCPNASVIGVDINAEMLAVAQRRRGRAYRELVRGSAERLVLADSSVDVVVLALAFHDLPDPLTSMRELRRVLRPGGRLLCLELTLPDSPVIRRRYVRLLTGLAALRDWLRLGQLGHVIDEVLSTPPDAHLQGIVNKAGFELRARRTHDRGLATSYLFALRPQQPGPVKGPS